MNLSVTDAIISAQKLREHMGSPTIHEFLAPPNDDDLTKWPTMFARPGSGAVKVAPTVVFSRINFGALPMPWLPHYIQWAVPLKRWQQFEQCYEIWLKKRESTRIDDLPLNNGVVAGLLVFLYALDADSILRQFLFSWAITEPLGAYFVGEANHLPEERPMILAAVERDPRLLYWLNQLPQFRQITTDKCSSRSDLWAGLAVAQRDANAVENWLERLGLNASTDADAACAALILQPHANQNQKATWMGTVSAKGAIEQAFNCLWWSRLSWDPCEFEQMAKELRPVATADRAKYWFNWATKDMAWGESDFETAPVDPLWSVEFLNHSQTRMSRLETTLRVRMLERLQQDCTDLIAPIILQTLNTGVGR